MGLAATKARLGALTRELELRWEETRAGWRDDKGDEFNRFMNDLSAEVARTLGTIETLDALIRKARNDCE